MHFYRFLSAVFVLCALSMVGCGGSKETTTIGADEVQRYVNENADALAAEDAIADAEDAAEDNDSFSENTE